ncbi:hypothetical protein AB0B50_39015 [Streptomyces sp. NPDC041068]|uniref:hypothetical protein n=1 Tax=Streptomyces sp. NPDC041068 TaxID=3155130 RepID=UPI0033D2A05C
MTNLIASRDQAQGHGHGQKAHPDQDEADPETEPTELQTDQARQERNPSARKSVRICVSSTSGSMAAQRDQLSEATVLTWDGRTANKQDHNRDRWENCAHCSHGQRGG